MHPALALPVLAALALALPGRAHAAPGRGLVHQKTIHADAVDAMLRQPEGLACDDRGALVVADTGNARLLTFKWKDGAFEPGTQHRLSQLPYPVRLQIDSQGNVIALDRRSRRLVRVDARGMFGGYVEVKGGPALVPTAFKLDARDNVLVLDLTVRKVVTFSPDGRILRELPLPAAAGITDVAIDSAGRVYVVDAVSATVFAADPGAKEFTAITKGLKEMVNFPVYLQPDNHGKLYLVDQNGNAVVRLGVDGSFQGRELAMGWEDGSVYYPQQLCINADGDVFVADRNNNRVQIFTTGR